jgi:hypothetical protein
MVVMHDTSVDVLMIEGQGCRGYKGTLFPSLGHSHFSSHELG